MAKKKLPVSERPLLKGRTAIVTGSSRNIGKAIALAFARAGANVVVNSHGSPEALEQVVGEIEGLGAQALAVAADAADPRQVDAMVEKATKHFGGLDIAVSNVGVRRKQPFLEISVEDWQQILNINLNTAFYLDRAVLPGMKARRFGRIIHISGISGFASHVLDRAHTIVSKAGVHALSQALALEFGPYGITANSVVPGVIDTDRDWKQYAEPDEWLRMKTSQIPLGRIGRPEDIAAACIYLATDSGSYVNGLALHVNGGQFRF